MGRFKKVLSAVDTEGLVEEGAVISEERTNRDVRVVCMLGGIYGGEERDVLYVIPGRFTGRPNEAPSPIFMPDVVDYFQRFWSYVTLFAQCYSTKSRDCKKLITPPKSPWARL